MKAAWITTLVGLVVWGGVGYGLFTRLDLHRDGGALLFYGFVGWFIGFPAGLLFYLNRKYPEPPKKS